MMATLNNGSTSHIKKAKDFPPGMAPKMLNLLESLENLEDKLKPLISKPHHEVFAKLEPLDRSKFGLLEAYAVNSLFWVLMKCSKEDVSQSLLEDYKIEMGRLREIQGQLAEVEARADRPQVNAEVASRIIRSGIGKPQKRNKNESGNKGKKFKSETHPAVKDE